MGAPRLEGMRPSEQRGVANVETQVIDLARQVQREKTPSNKSALLSSLLLIGKSIGYSSLVSILDRVAPEVGAKVRALIKEDEAARPALHHPVLPSMPEGVNHKVNVGPPLREGNKLPAQQKKIFMNQGVEGGDQRVQAPEKGKSAPVRQTAFKRNNPVAPVKQEAQVSVPSKLENAKQALNKMVLPRESLSKEQIGAMLTKLGDYCLTEGPVPGTYSMYMFNDANLPPGERVIKLEENENGPYVVPLFLDPNDPAKQTYRPVPNQPQDNFEKYIEARAMRGGAKPNLVGSEKKIVEEQGSSKVHNTSDFPPGFCDNLILSALAKFNPALLGNKHGADETTFRLPRSGAQSHLDYVVRVDVKNQKVILSQENRETKQPVPFDATGKFFNLAITNKQAKPFLEAWESSVDSNPKLTEPQLKALTFLFSAWKSGFFINEKNKADFKYTSAEMSKALNQLGIQFASVDKLLSLINQLPLIDPQGDHKFSKEALVTLFFKTVGHTWGVDINVRKEGNELKTALFPDLLSFARLASSIEGFFNEPPVPGSAVSQLSSQEKQVMIEAFAKGVIYQDEEPQRPDEILADFNAGKPVTMPTGWEGHSISVTIFKGPSGEKYLAYTNRDEVRDGNDRAATQIFKIRGNIDQEFIRKINSKVFDVSQFMQRISWFERGGMINEGQLEPFIELDKTKQKMANCTWANNKGAFNATLFLMQLEKNLTTMPEAKAIEAAKTTSSQIYKEWQFWNREKELKSFMDGRTSTMKDPTLNTSFFNISEFTTMAVIFHKFLKKKTEYEKNPAFQNTSINASLAKIETHLKNYLNMCIENPAFSIQDCANKQRYVNDVEGILKSLPSGTFMIYKPLNAELANDNSLVISAKVDTGIQHFTLIGTPEGDYKVCKLSADGKNLDPNSNIRVKSLKDLKSVIPQMQIPFSDESTYYKAFG